MAQNRGQSPQDLFRNRAQAVRQTQDVPGCIKYILLVLLVLLLLTELAAGEFKNIREGSRAARGILSLKLFLIGLIIALIRIERALQCQITSPMGCTEEEPDPVQGRYFVRVKGTAGGLVFGHYTLDIRDAASTVIIPGVVTYPGGGATGTVPVFSGELGQITTTSLMDGAYEITLTVYPAGPEAPKVCTTAFDLLKAIVYINRLAGVPAISMSPVPNNPNPLDPTAELRSGGRPVAVGGWDIDIEGAAYIYGCSGREITDYEIRYARVTAPGGEPAQPNTGDPIPGAWPLANRVAPPLEYSIPAEYQPWTRVGPAPTHLINSWNSMTVGGTTYYKLAPGSWNSTVIGSGRFSLLLTAEDTTSTRYYDIQNIWLDNETILGQIVKFQRKNPKSGVWEDIPNCTDLLLSFGTIRVVGLAWDPVIDTAWWPAVAPNDNFDHYQLQFWKQFGPAHDMTGAIANRVPALPVAPPVPTPTTADADELAQWDLVAALDYTGAPPAPDPKLARGDSCTYIIQLFVTDNSVVADSGTHYIYHQVPVKIVNDL
jgi:hypothetical protein